MWNVKILDDSEAVANEDDGYMERRMIPATFVCIIGDKIVSWSTNNLEQSVSISN